jgi:hypothetical protein
MTPGRLMKKCRSFLGLDDSVFQVYIVAELSAWTLFTLKMVVLRSSETSVTVYYFTCRPVPEYINIHEHFRENLRSRNNKQFQLR